MSGEIHRLKGWINYRQKGLPAPGMLYEGLKTVKGSHTVVVILGAVDESQPVTEKWVEDKMRSLGWERVKDSEQARAIPDGAKYPAVSR